MSCAPGVPESIFGFEKVGCALSGSISVKQLYLTVKNRQMIFKLPQQRGVNSGAELQWLKSCASILKKALVWSSFSEAEWHRGKAQEYCLSSGQVYPLRITLVSAMLWEHSLKFTKMNSLLAENLGCVVTLVTLPHQNIWSTEDADLRIYCRLLLDTNTPIQRRRDCGRLWQDGTLIYFLLL